MREFEALTDDPLIACPDTEDPNRAKPSRADQGAVQTPSPT
jgi:hypothetical protein